MINFFFRSHKKISNPKVKLRKRKIKCPYKDVNGRCSHRKVGKFCKFKNREKRCSYYYEWLRAIKVDSGCVETLERDKLKEDCE